MSQRGFSIIEVILSVAIFAIIASGMVGLILNGLESNRLAAEETIATEYASSGLEAVRSIKNQNFLSLTNSLGTGVAKSGGVWTFSGSSNVYDSKYTRVITISDVAKDVNGYIVSSGGSLDWKIKKVTSTVSWNVTPTRSNSVVLSSYLSYWKSPNVRGGVLVYADGATSTDSVKYKVLDSVNGTWSSPASVADVDSGSTNRALRRGRMYSSSTRNEKILVSRHTNGSNQYIYAQVFNGSNWGNVTLLANWTSGSFIDVANFDGSYLANGDFMVVYSDNTSTPKFQTWDGSNWSGSGISTQNVGDVPNYIVTRARPGTNEVMLAVFDQSEDTNTVYFNGGSYIGGNWTLHTEHSNVAPTNAREYVDFTWSNYNSLKGALIYSDLGSDKSTNIRIWIADGSGGGSWSTTANTSAQGTIRTIKLSSRSTAEEFLSCNKDSNNDIYCFKSDSTPSWSDPTNQRLSTTTQGGNQRSLDLAYEPYTGSQAIVVYSDNSSTPKLKKYDALTNTFDSAATSITSLGGTVYKVTLIPREDSDEVMILMADNNEDLYSVVWNGVNDALYSTPTGKAFSTHGTSGTNNLDYWFDFAWDKF